MRPYLILPLLLFGCAEPARTPAPAAAAGPPAIAQLARGAQVSVAGTVARILDEDEFLLSDASGSIRVDIGPNPMPVRAGEQVTVRGRVDDGPRRELYASELVRADGSVVRFERRW